ncbi:hypothetical protein OUZ56_026283 [Daphnia magna]|uniref:Uncharacterized protein n=1 Tax=Daphnia magna TaxID=35525 RepID=A0ABQ9ZLD6_9CRUS|nr:hypothetical protein OUZ56_026283 [Daphnia magna]
MDNCIAVFGLELYVGYGSISSLGCITKNVDFCELHDTFRVVYPTRDLKVGKLEALLHPSQFQLPKASGLESPNSVTASMIGAGSNWKVSDSVTKGIPKTLGSPSSSF